MPLFSFPSQVNERAARLVAATVATSLVLAIILRLPWAVAVIAAGFLLRVGWGPMVSPLARAAMWTAARLGPPRPVFGPPKRFAQGVGAVCTVTACALFLAGAPLAAWILVGGVVIVALLEAVFALCLGCQMYRLLQRVGVFPADACVDCAPPRAG